MKLNHTFCFTQSSNSPLYEISASVTSPTNTDWMADSEAEEGEKGGGVSKTEKDQVGGVRVYCVKECRPTDRHTVDLPYVSPIKVNDVG